MREPKTPAPRDSGQDQGRVYGAASIHPADKRLIIVVYERTFGRIAECMADALLSIGRRRGRIVKDVLTVLAVEHLGGPQVLPGAVHGASSDMASSPTVQPTRLSDRSVGTFAPESLVE